MKCDPLDLGSHDWQPFGKTGTLLKCARRGCGLVVTKMLFDGELRLPGTFHRD